ncbi:MAG: hypothetical protein ACJAUP_001254 [Cellvibrionaceae bacterium]|jgi:hypothetical protein
MLELNRKLSPLKQLTVIDIVSKMLLSNAREREGHLLHKDQSAP